MLSCLPRNLRKSLASTLFYLFVCTVAMVVLIPVYFLGTLSLMSDFEAYNEWPLPLTPALTSEFLMEKTEESVLVSIRKRTDGSFAPLIESDDPGEISRFLKRKTNCFESEETLGDYLDKTAADSPLTFTLRRSLIANYRTFFSVTDNAVSALWRSIYVALITIILSLVIGGSAGYAFARYAFRGKNSLKLSVLFVRMYPAVSIAVPMVIILGKIGLYDHPFGLALVYAVAQIGMSVWITSSVFMGIPVEFEEAARVFGANRLGAFLHITLPLALPGLAACAMYAFIGSWNETVQAIVLTQSNPTFPVVVYQTLVGAKGMVNLTAAGSLVMAFPAIVFTFIIRNYIIRLWGGVDV